MAPRNKLRYNKATNSYEPLVNPPLTGGGKNTTTTTVAPAAKPKPVVGPTAAPARPTRGRPKVDVGAATSQGWSNVYSPNPAESSGATSALGDMPSAEDEALRDLFDRLSGGGGGGPTTAQKRAGGLQAARIFERAGRRGANLYEQQAANLANELQGIYDPLFTQQQTGIDAQRKAAMEFLTSQYGGNEQAINQATQAALAAIPQQSMAYQNVPIVNLQQEQNPLLSALGAYGASGEAATAQSAADAQVAQQLADLVRGSAGQMSTAQQAILDAARSDVQTGGASALQQLALARQAQEAGINAEQMRALNELSGARAASAADIANARQALMSQGIESLLGGMTEGAAQRAKTVAEYGPAPKKKDKGRNLPIGGKGKNKGRK